MRAALLGSKAREAVLLQLFLNPDQEYYLRELVRITGFAPRTIQVVLDQLREGDLILERRSGNRRYLRANVDSPLYRPLQELLLRSEGFSGVLREALGEEGIEFAFVFGSMADGTATAYSDVDLLVVGEIGLRETIRRLQGVEDIIGREITPIVWNLNEYMTRLKEEEHFLASVLKRPLLALIGEPVESCAMA
jgi:predicted nucleotidyltransferase